MSKLLSVAFICLLALTPIADSDTRTAGAFVHESDVSWKTNQFPIHRWKTLVGAGAGGRSQPDDIMFGTWELAPHAIYHGHKHPAPEIYYIISGRALWTVGDETREVSQGTAIFTKPGAVHRMENISDEPVQAIWIWWAPDGNRDVFWGKYSFTEKPPIQADNAGFAD